MLFKQRLPDGELKVQPNSTKIRVFDSLIYYHRTVYLNEFGQIWLNRELCVANTC